MTNFKKLLLLSFSFIILFSCKKSENNNTQQIPKYGFLKDSNKLYFSIVQLNDVYEISPIQGGKYGGMARVATIYKQEKKNNPNTLLMLAGDFLNPSLLGTIKVNGERVRGKQMVEVMNAMDFDLVAFGNHEFDLSYDNLQKRINESNFDWISSNVYHNVDGKEEYFYKEITSNKENVKQTYIKEFSNGNKKVRLGFISVCIPSNPRSYVRYTDMFNEAKKAYDEVSKEVDVVLGLTHVKIEHDRKIAEMLPNIPLIMGGHEHTNKYEKVGSSLITKADANAKTIYIHRFEYDPKSKKLRFNSELKTVDEKIKSDLKVGKVVDKWESILANEIKEIVPNPNEIVFHAKEPLDARDTPIRSKQTNMGEIVAASMSNAFDNEVDCALVNGGSIRIDDELFGDISAVDIFRVLPYGGAILKVKLKGKLLKEVLDFGRKASGTGAYLQRYNVQLENDIWKLKNSIIVDNKTYTVAFSDYLLKGFDIPFLKRSNSQVIDIYTPTKEEQASDIRKAVITYLKSK
ncbi:MAG: bifunctional metallophosphatase/5'-nucleotidase [Tenacibaculum sp.]|nr:bifunctional metallophosphatase/5'-nucleotidase [Tenacibaculum sp.]